VRDAFRATTGETTAAAWQETSGRLRVDLRVAARLLLAASGVTTVAILGPCTMCGHGYASYRRDGPSAGRQLSFVGWAAP
jgi:copper oxidase (laccase) domain-containing protein